MSRLRERHRSIHRRRSCRAPSYRYRKLHRTSVPRSSPHQFSMYSLRTVRRALRTALRFIEYLAEPARHTRAIGAGVWSDDIGDRDVFATVASYA